MAGCATALTALYQHLEARTGFTYPALEKTREKTGSGPMAQFTVESLARLLKNVDRELLVDALAEAELSQLLTNDTIETIAELQTLFNLASNIRVFGPALFAREFDRIVSDFLESAPITAGILNTAGFIVDTITSTNQRLSVVQQLLRDLVGSAVSEEDKILFKRNSKIQLDLVQVHALHGLEHLVPKRKNWNRAHIAHQYEQCFNHAQRALNLLDDL